MGKAVKNKGLLGLLPALAAILVSLPNGPVSAQSSGAPVPMPEVLVSASRLAGDLAQPTRDVLVIDAHEIARRAPASIADLLGSLPGVDLRSRGPAGVQADLEIDGATFEQVLILVDGVRATDPQTGHHNLNIPLDPADLERVEVLYGAGSAVHGPDAFGGVVNLVPKQSVTPRVDVAARWGSSLDAVANGGSSAVASDASIRWGWQAGERSLWVSAGKRRSDGYRDGTDFDEDRVFARARIPASGGVLTIDAGIQDKGFGARDFYAPFPSREWTTAQTAAITFRRGALTVRGYGRRHSDRFILWSSEPARYDNRHRSVLAGTEAFARLSAGGGDVALGGEWVHEGIDSNNLGDRSRLRASLFGEYGRLLPTDVRVVAGWRFDHHETFGWEASPSLGVSRSIGPGRLFASVARSYRAPSFTETFYTDPNNVGNPDLGAERAWQYEVGGELVAADVHTHAALFVRREENLIDYIRPADTPPWQAQNLGEMETVGLRLRTDRTWRHANASAGYTWIDKEQTLAAGLESKYVFTHPTQQFSARLHHDLPLLAGAVADWQLIARQRMAPLDDYQVLDVSVSLPMSYGRVLGRVRNLLDERYEAVAGVPQPGRWFGLETSINL